MGDVTSGGHALGVLIDAVCDANRWSDEDVARRARARGHKLSKSNISRIRTEPVKTINAPLMHSLADGLGLPVGQVLQAALRAMGLPNSDAPTGVEGAVKADPSLIPEARRHLIAQYQLLLRIAHEPPKTVDVDAAERARQEAAQAARGSEVVREIRRRSVPAAKPRRKGPTDKT